MLSAKIELLQYAVSSDASVRLNGAIPFVSTVSMLVVILIQPL